MYNFEASRRAEAANLYVAISQQYRRGRITKETADDFRAALQWVHSLPEQQIRTP